MANTARSVAKLQEEGKFPPLAIFIAGIAHFVPPNFRSADSLLLKAWYDEIAQHKAAILIEKESFEKFLEPFWADVRSLFLAQKNAESPISKLPRDLVISIAEKICEL